MPFTDQQWADILREDKEVEDGPGWVFAIRVAAKDDAGDAPTTAVAVSAVRLDGSERGFIEAQDIALEIARRRYRKEFGTDIPEAEGRRDDVSDEDDDE